MPVVKNFKMPTSSPTLFLSLTRNNVSLSIFSWKRETLGRLALYLFDFESDWSINVLLWLGYIKNMDRFFLSHVFIFCTWEWLIHMVSWLVQPYNYILRQCKEFQYIWSCRLFTVAKSKRKLEHCFHFLLRLETIKVFRTLEYFSRWHLSTLVFFFLFFFFFFIIKFFCLFMTFLSFGKTDVTYGRHE